MSTLDALLNNYLSNDTALDAFLPFVLQTLTHTRLLANQPNHNNQLHKWSLRVSALLQSKLPNARWAGACLAAETAKQSPELFTANVASWTTALLSMLTRSAPTVQMQAIISALSALLSKTVARPELQREVTSSSLPRFVTCLLDLVGNKELMPSILQALEASMVNFPTLYRPFVDRTQTLCLSILSGGPADEPQLVELAARCFASMSRVGGRVSSQDYWRLSVNRCLASLHIVLDQLLNTVDEESVPASRLNPFEMAPVPDDYTKGHTILLSRLQALMCALTELLGCKPPTPVNVPVDGLLGFVCRLYNINDSCVMVEYKDKDEFGAVILLAPTLHLQANQLLSSMILALGDHLLRHIRPISDYILCLLSTSKIRRILRVSTYALVQTSISCYGIGFVKFIDTPLVSALLNDIRLPQRKPVDILNTDSTSGAKKNPRKRGFQATNSDALSKPYIVEDMAGDDVRHAALKVLKQLLIAAGAALPVSLRASVDSVLVGNLMTTESDLEGENVQSTWLLTAEALLSSLLSPTEGLAAPLPYALHIFEAGTHGLDLNTRVFCTQALAVCDLITHSRLPPLPRSTVATTTPMAGLMNVHGVQIDADSDDEMAEAYHLTEIVVEPILAQRIAKPIIDIEMEMEEQELPKSTIVPLSPPPPALPRSEPIPNRTESTIPTSITPKPMPVEVIPAAPSTPKPMPITVKPAATSVRVPSQIENSSDEEEFPELVNEGPDDEDD